MIRVRVMTRMIIESGVEVMIRVRHRQPCYGVQTGSRGTRLARLT
jgi:hypothetical protein